MAASATTAQTIDVVTPAAGESVTEGTILEWHVKVGDAIKYDDTIVEISTDKVDVELPSPASGTVSEILVEEGDTVTVGQVIARIITQTEGSPTAAPPPQWTVRAGRPPPTVRAARAPPTVRAARVPPPLPPPQPPPANGAALDGGASSAQTGTSGTPEGVRVSPVAARAAAAEGIDLARVSGSGPAGRSRRPTCSAPAPATAERPPIHLLLPPSSDGRGDRSAGRGGAHEGRGGGARPLHGAVALDPHRHELSHADRDRAGRPPARAQGGGRKVSFTHLIAYAIARAAQDMPVMAEHFAEIEGRPHRVSDGQVNLGLAVDVEKRDGTRTLMVPVIQNAAHMPSSASSPPTTRWWRRRARTRSPRTTWWAATLRSPTPGDSARSPRCRG